MQSLPGHQQRLSQPSLAVVTGGFVEASSQASAPLSGHSHSRPCSTCTPMDTKNSQKVSWLPG